MWFFLTHIEKTFHAKILLCHFTFPLNEESRRRERGLNNQFEANIIDNRGRSKN